MNRPLRTHFESKAVIWAASALTLAVTLAFAWWAYRPGLSGDFLFDDFANLPAIGATGPVDRWATFWRYITSGTADPTGRPVTLLTFLIDARNWPASPYPFKVTNVVLQLINGALLFWVLWKLGSVFTREGRAQSLPRTRSGARFYDDAARETPFVGAGLPATGAAPADQSTGHARARPYEGAALLPPSAGRGTEGDAPWIAAASPRAVRDPLRPEGGDLLLPSAGRRTEEDADVAAAASSRAARGALRPEWCDRRAVAIAALFGAGAWLLHPLFVSATLYIVQREAMLPATFVLIGTLGWIASRRALANGHVGRALVGMALSAWLCTGLAVLSKANGALFPILLLLTEWIVLAPHEPMPTAAGERVRRRAVVVFLVLPSIAVIGYLLSMLPGSIASAPAVRGWTVGQRLLTEPRVLTDYLRLLFIPHAYSTGLFNDQFAISTSWLHPASTLPCIALILGLIGAGFALRKRHPAIALALLFYFAGQLMESGWIPLELYFEHRSYLPAMLLFWPIGLALGRAGTLRFLRVTAAACILLILAGLTWQRSTLWGDGMHQAEEWAARNPDSARAQANAALYDLAHDRPRLAAARLELSMPKHPDDIQAPINLISAECRLGGVQPTTLAHAEYALAHTRLGGQAAFKWFDEALALAARNACPGLGFTALQRLLDAARGNPHWIGQSGRQQDLDHLQGELDVVSGDPDQALAMFNRALAADPRPAAALQQAAYFGSHGYPKLGLKHLAFYATLPPGPKPRFGMPRIHAWVLQREGWWPKEIAYLRKNLESDAAARATDHHPAAHEPATGARIPPPPRSSSRAGSQVDRAPIHSRNRGLAVTMRIRTDQPFRAIPLDPWQHASASE